MIAARLFHDGLVELVQVLLETLVAQVRRVESTVGVEPCNVTITSSANRPMRRIMLMDRKSHILLDPAAILFIKLVDRHEILPILDTSKFTLIEFAYSNRRIQVHSDVCVFLKLVHLGPVLLILEIEVALMAELDV